VDLVPFYRYYPNRHHNLQSTREKTTTNIDVFPTHHRFLHHGFGNRTVWNSVLQVFLDCEWGRFDTGKF